MISADTLTEWLERLDQVDARVTDMLTSDPGDEAPALDYQVEFDELRDLIQQARLDALRKEVA